MDFQTLTLPDSGVTGVNADALVVVLPAAGDLPAFGGVVDEAIADAIKGGDLERKAGKSLYLPRLAGTKAGRVLLAVARDASPKAFKAAVAGALGALKTGPAKHVAVVGGGNTAAHAEALAVAGGDATYHYSQTKPSAPPAPALSRLSYVVPRASLAAAKQGLAVGAAIVSGMNLARECANLPANHATPTFLGEQALAMARSHGLEVEVLDRKQCEKLGMGSFLSVARGSEEPPKFIVMQWKGGGRKDAPVVLVGKGITFDTGGISLKPGAEMDEMKFDMCGAASVLGTLRAVAELKLKANVVGLVPTCDNMPSGKATKPGDVVTSLSGQTIEILNTDAEGRLILCDALTYAERFKPAAVVDIATLTGAIVIALGHHNSGLFSPDDTLAGELQAAAQAGLDPVWRMPLDEEYDELLKSNFADMANIGGRAGGSVTAAKFLQRFAGKFPWAHLDIAGTAHRSGAHKGATGRPVSLLTHFVMGRAGK
ncbi:MAG TPA: leucyl aminopeptidase [Burkholderiaceae bacterium]